MEMMTTISVPLLPAASPASQLAKLRWVAEAKERDGGGYMVRTKPHVFTTLLTHHVRAGDSQYDPDFEVGQPLKENVRVELPEYWVHLTESDFYFSFVEKPERARAGRVGVIPQYHSVQDVDGWAVPFLPCYGNSINYSPEGRSTKYDYREAKTWVEKAMVASIYLQSAEPHYGEMWYNTAFAYRLGLVGDEYRDDVQQENAVVAGIPEPSNNLETQ